MTCIDIMLCVLLPLLFISGVYLVWQFWRLSKDNGSSYEPRITTPLWGKKK